MGTREKEREAQKRRKGEVIRRKLAETEEERAAGRKRHQSRQHGKPKDERRGGEKDHTEKRTTIRMNGGKQEKKEHRSRTKSDALLEDAMVIINFVLVCIFEALIIVNERGARNGKREKKTHRRVHKPKPCH